MGRFVVTRTALGVFFLLESSGGMALATSRSYKNLDACKKGIASLVADLPEAPLVDATAGERAPNPKIELVASGAGYAFLVKAPNGRTVITSSVYATKKAAKRAISMLRTAVSDATLVFSREAGLAPLTMKKTPQRGVPAISKVRKAPAEAPVAYPVSPVESTLPQDALTLISSDAVAADACRENDPAEREDPPFAETPDGVAEAAAETSAEQTRPLTAPRLIRVGEMRGATPNATPAESGKGAEKQPAAGRSALLSRLLGRK